MYKIESNRLILLSLTQEQIVLLSRSRAELEQSLGLIISNFQLNTSDEFLVEFYKALSDIVIPMLRGNPDNYIWFTHWLIINKSKNLTIGGIGGSGLPNNDGQIIIGYFIDKKFENQGYATEAVRSFTDWMFLNPDLKSVIADTPLDNIGSQKVLEKVGFKSVGQVKEGLRWKLAR